MNYIRRQVIKKYIAYLLRKLAINVLYITFFVLNNQYYGLPSVLVMTFVTKWNQRLYRHMATLLWVYKLLSFWRTESISIACGSPYKNTPKQHLTVILILILIKA